MLGFAGHMVSVTIAQFCHCNEKAAMDNTKPDEHSCTPMKLKQAAGCI